MLKAIPNDLNIHPGWFKFKIYEDGQLIGKTETAKFKFWRYLEIEMVIQREHYTIQIEQRKLTEPQGIKLIKNS